MTTDVNGAPGGQPPTSRNPSSPYCQRWTGGRHSWRHVSEGGFDATLFDVRPIPEALARSIVASHHYAGTLPATRLSWGLLTRDDRLIDDSTPLSGGLGLVGVREDEAAGGLARAVRQDDRAAHHLVGLARVDRELEGDLDGGVELLRAGLLREVHRLGGRVELVAVDLRRGCFVNLGLSHVVLSLSPRP